MPKVALYPGGNRKADYFSLPLARRKFLGSKVRISQTVINQLIEENAGLIDEIADRGIRLADR